jgi:hypothetical protein
MRSHVLIPGAITKFSAKPFVLKNEIESKDFQEVARLPWAHMSPTADPKPPRSPLTILSHRRPVAQFRGMP